MKTHTYDGCVSDGVFTLLTDGKPEKPRTHPFLWGEGNEPNLRDLVVTATRILSREIPVPAVYQYIVPFAEEVLAKLPANKPWQLTSSDIRSWMAERVQGEEQSGEDETEGGDPHQDNH